MAYLRFNTALKRIREVVEQSASVLLSVPAYRFMGDLPQGLDDESAMARAISKPRVESSITSVTPSSSSPPVLGDLRIYEVQVSVKVLRVVTPLEQVSDADRDELQALAAQDADVLSQALGFPGNLARTAGGEDTEIVSGLLVYRSSSVLVGKRTDDGAQTITTTHVFRGHMLSRPDTGFASTDFVLLIQTDLIDGQTQSNPNQFRFNGVGTYTIDWGDGQVETVSGNVTHTYATIGVYRIRVSNWTGATRHLANPSSFGSASDACKILELQNWGNTSWTSCAGMFALAKNMVGTYRDKPNLSASNISFSRMFFVASKFNGSPYASMNDWDVSNVTNMFVAFTAATSFDQPIGNWNVSNVTDMTSMFQSDSPGTYGLMRFNQDIGSWNVGNVTTMAGMFRNNVFFNQNLNSWNTSKVTNMSLMFVGATAFNGAIGNWDVSNVTDMTSMFQGATAFNQDLNWTPSKVTNMTSMFRSATAFNGAIGGWDVSNVTNMAGMFRSASSFNKPIGNWNVGKVTSFGGSGLGMFEGATSFNQPLNDWNVSSAVNMRDMFSSAFAFNQPLNSWNVANVTDMIEMFQFANAFDQDLGAWVLNNNVNLANMLSTNSTAEGMSAENYSRTLIGWANERSATGNPNSRSLGATNRRYTATVYGGSPYDNAVSARANLVLATGSGGGGWTISGDAQI